jgi:hypothetical protein
MLYTNKKKTINKILLKQQIENEMLEKQKKKYVDLKQNNSKISIETKNIITNNINNIDKIEPYIETNDSMLKFNLDTTINIDEFSIFNNTNIEERIDVEPQNTDIILKSDNNRMVDTVMEYTTDKDGIIDLENYIDPESIIYTNVYSGGTSGNKSKNTKSIITTEDYNEPIIYDKKGRKLVSRCSSCN